MNTLRVVQPAGRVPTCGKGAATSTRTTHGVVPSLTVLVLILSWSLWRPQEARAEPDQIRLRDGEVLSGTVFQEGANDYTFVPAEVAEPGATSLTRTDAGRLQRIPRSAVGFVVYGDDAKADRVLGLSDVRRLCKDPSPAPVEVLTAEGMGLAILDAARSARTSIWIAAYYLSASRVSPIKDFYDTLEQKAQSGVDVVLVAEYGQATPPSVKSSTRNFASELAQKGVKVLLLGERKALHKKLLIVDGKVVFLGSSNLTSAGTLFSNEMNLRVESPVFVRQVLADFQRTRDRAVPLERWMD